MLSRTPTDHLSMHSPETLQSHTESTHISARSDIYPSNIPPEFPCHRLCFKSKYLSILFSYRKYGVELYITAFEPVVSIAIDTLSI